MLHDRSGVTRWCPIGDVRFSRFYDAIKASTDRSTTLRLLPTEAIIGALAAASHDQDALLSNVIATEALNRVRRTGAVLDHMAEGVCGIDTRGVITYANPSAERMLGMPAGEIIGRPADSVVQAHDAEGTPLSACQDVWGVVLADQQPMEREDVQFTRRTGERFPVSCRISPIRDDADDGEVAGVILTFYDIAARRGAQAQLREQDGRIRALFDTMADAVACISGDGIVTYASPAFATVLGISPAEALGGPWQNLLRFDAGRENATIDETRPVDEALHACAGTHRIVRPDGVPACVDIRVSQVFTPGSDGARAGGLPEYVAVIRDVTERERTRAELARSEKRYRNLTETMAEIVMLCDVEGRLSYVSPASVPVLGFQPEELEGTSIFDLTPREDAKRVRYELSTLSKGMVRTVTTRITCRDGTTRWFEASVRLGPEFDDKPSATLLIVARDVTGSIDQDVQAVASQLASDLLNEWPEPGAVLESIIPLATPTESSAPTAPVREQPANPNASSSRSSATSSPTANAGNPAPYDALGQMNAEARRLAHHLHMLAHCVRAQRQPIHRQATNLGEVARQVAEPIMWRDADHALELHIASMPTVEVDAELARVFFHVLIHQALHDAPMGARVRINLGPGPSPDGFAFEYMSRAQVPEHTGAAGAPSMELTTAATIVGRHGGELHVESMGARRRVCFTWQESPETRAAQHGAAVR